MCAGQPVVLTTFWQLVACAHATAGQLGITGQAAAATFAEHSNSRNTIPIIIVYFMCDLLLSLELFKLSPTPDFKCGEEQVKIHANLVIMNV